MRLGRIAAGMGLCLSASLYAQSGSLPMPEGIWVDVDTPCASATSVFVHGSGRFGQLYFYGPNQGMGPSDETEALVRSGLAGDGFTMINEGPLEVKALTGGRFAVRAFSPSQGAAAWTETVRLCPPATLSPRMRAATETAMRRGR